MTFGVVKRPPAGPDIETEVERMLAMGREIRSHMTEPVSSDLSDFSQTDIEPMLKD